MYLKSLEIAGFKSFSKKGVLEFNAPITAIVGPNGSGKSNVAEAFRFVLGEQSIKSMRGKRGEDLIFNGGHSQGRLNRASVKVIFDNSKRDLNIDFDEVTLERVVHRDSANEYFINGSAVRLKDIGELLAGAHIGASGHHIISQGEADRILNANIRERREMIEEALGLKVYHFKREESERKLEKTQANLKEVYSLRKEIAPHIRFLEKQVERVEKAREMRIQLEGLYKEYFKTEFLYLENTKKKIELDLKAPLQKKTELEAQLLAAKEILSHSEQKDVKSQEVLDLEIKRSEVRSLRDSLNHDIGRIEGQLAAEQRSIRKQHELISSLETKTVQLRDVEHVTERIYTQMQTVDEQTDTASLKKLLQDIRETLQHFISENRSQTDMSVIQELEKEVERLIVEKQQISEKIQAIKAQEDVLNTQYSELRLAIEREKDTNREAEKAVFTIMAQQNEVHSQLTALRLQQENITLIEQQFAQDVQEAATLVGRAVLGFIEELKQEQNNNNQVENSGNDIQIDRQTQIEKRKVIERIKIRLEDAGGGSGEDILKEFNETKERDAFLAREIDDLEKSAETLYTLIKELQEKLTIEFKAGVEKINAQFQHFFSIMFGGGTAHLNVIKEEKKKKKSDTDLDLDNMAQPADAEALAGEEGIDIVVNLPLKKVKALMMLSGGERALTSIALLFAISQVNPPPFIILDETDAALDEANSRKYGDMISTLSTYSQLILITHNRETMARAGVLYGVTMGAEGFSKLLSIQFDEAVKVAK